MLHLPSPLEKINIDFDNNISLYIKRDDLIHQHISGNKWRKLSCNIDAFKHQHRKILITVGGAYSNHIQATAAASKMYNIPSIGIIRGEELNIQSNDNLQFADEQGMQLKFVNREFYKKRYDDDFIDLVASTFNLNVEDIYFVPEGGHNELGAKGCEDIVSEINIDFDYICTACGTGTTLAGITNKLHEHQTAIGFNVVHSNFDLEKNIRELTDKKFELMHQYNFGGYAKTNELLLNFIRSFYTETSIKLDYVYTGKMMFGIFDLIESHYFKKNATIIAVHTGGVLNADII